MAEARVPAEDLLEMMLPAAGTSERATFTVGQLLDKWLSWADCSVRAAEVLRVVEVEAADGSSTLFGSGEPGLFSLLEREVASVLVPGVKIYLGDAVSRTLLFSVPRED